MSEYIKDDIMSAETRSVKWGKDTNISCPTCGKGEKPNTLRVRPEIMDNTVSLECPVCGYIEHRPVDNRTWNQ